MLGMGSPGDWRGSSTSFLRSRRILRSRHGFDSSGEPAVLEGVLMKYKPGVANMYLERWCQATRYAFSYYVSKAEPKSWQTRPLVTVPLDCVEAVQKVSVTVPENPQDTPSTRYFQLASPI